MSEHLDLSDAPVMELDVLDPWQRMKRRRMSRVREMLEFHKRVDKKEFVAKLEIESGLNRKTAYDYLRAFKDAGYTQESNGHVLWIDKSSTDE